MNKIFGERKQARKKEKKKERRRRPKMQIAIENLKTAGAEDYLVIVPARGIQEGRGEDHGVVVGTAAEIDAMLC